MQRGNQKMVISDALPREAAPSNDHQPTKYEQYRTIRGWVIDDLANSHRPFAGEGGIRHIALSYVE